MRGSLPCTGFLYLEAGKYTDLGCYAKEFVLSSSGCYNKNTIYCALNNKHLFLIVLETGKSKIKVPADLVLIEDLPPDL